MATGEKQFILGELQVLPPNTAAINLSDPDFGAIFNAVLQLRTQGYNPDLIFAPTELMIPLTRSTRAKLELGGITGDRLLIPPQTSLPIYWSTRWTPLNSFIILDSRKGGWRIKLDPFDGGRLTVAIGRPEVPPEAVTFLAETVAKYEIPDHQAVFVIPIEGVEAARKADET